MARGREAFPGALELSGNLLFVSGVVHCLAWIITGSSDATAGQFTFGILYLLLGLGLRYRVPKIRYPALIITLIGVLGAYATLGGSQVAIWLTRLFIALDLVVIVLLAASIWRGRQRW